VAWRATNAGFGKYSASGKSYLGVYATIGLDGSTLSFTTYGLGASAPDDTIDTFTLTR
jgi:hypothetical protein